MTTTSSTDVAGILAARKSELAAGAPQTEYPDAGPATAAITADEVIPAADARTGEIVPVSTANGTPPEGDGPRPPAAAPAAVEPARPPDYSMIPAKVLGGIPYASEYARLAKTICSTEMVPMSMRGAWDKVMAAFMRGYEMGLGPMQALDSFNVIDGKVGLKAEAMRALIMDGGHQIILEDLYDENSNVVAIAADCHRKDWPAEQWRTYRYSMEDARVAGLLAPSRSGKPTNWQKTPRAMLDARATSGAGRRYFADVLAGMSYTPEEIRDFDGPGEAPGQEAPPSPAAAAEASTPASQPPGATNPSPPAASAPATSSAAPPAQAAPAASTGGASATSLADAASSAPPTSSPPAKKAKGATKKAPARSAAPSAPAPEAGTPPAAPAPPAPSPSEETPGPNSDAAAAAPTPAGDSLATATAPPAATPAGNGEGSVLVQMRHALVEIIKGHPQAQQSLIRAFLQRHYPGGSDTMDTPEKIQKAIDIAVGWPDSAEQNPPPEDAGILKWEGFSTRVVDLGGELEARCDLCEWRLPQAETQKNLPDFRQLELSVAVCVSHEQDTYADGTPYCPAKPVQQTL